MLGDQPRSGMQDRIVGPGMGEDAPVLPSKHSPPHSPSWALTALFAEAFEPLIPNLNYLREGIASLKSSKAQTFYK